MYWKRCRSKHFSFLQEPKNLWSAHLDSIMRPVSRKLVMCICIQNVCIRLNNLDCVFCACFLLCMRPRGSHFDHWMRGYVLYLFSWCSCNRYGATAVCLEMVADHLEVSNSICEIAWSLLLMFWHCTCNLCLIAFGRSGIVETVRWHGALVRLERQTHEPKQNKTIVYISFTFSKVHYII